jgi:hypothetical protein
MYRTCTDPYATVADDINAERLRDLFVGQRTADLHAALLRPFTAMVEPEYAYSIDDKPIAVGADLGAWLEMQGQEVIGRCMFDPAYRADCIRMYVEARVRLEADRRNWRAESVEDIAWERGGMV